jgi:hypothetical protein
VALRPGVLGAAAALLGVLAGVGVGSAAAAAPTKAQARAFAGAVNLVAADLPGFTVTPKTKQTAADRRAGISFTRCAGGTPSSRDIVDVDSHDFARAGADGISELDASSNVSVVSSSHLASRDLARARSPRTKTCLIRGLDQLLSSMKLKGVKFGKFTATSDRRPAPGSNGTFGLRFRVTATAAGVRLPFWFDFRGFRLGPAEVTLSTFGILVPFPTADEDGLFALLVSRAQAHRLAA